VVQVVEHDAEPTRLGEIDQRPADGVVVVKDVRPVDALDAEAARQHARDSQPRIFDGLARPQLDEQRALEREGRQLRAEGERQRRLANPSGAAQERDGAASRDRGEGAHLSLAADEHRRRVGQAIPERRFHRRRGARPRYCATTAPWYMFIPQVKATLPVAGTVTGTSTA